MASAMASLSNKEEERSKDRQDFMKRFFSVAVSVGFASKIGSLTFLSTFTIPTESELHQLVLLIFAMVIIVGSWEFYFSSVHKMPLVDCPRFVVDIAIVSLYIAMLSSVKLFDSFFLYLDVIMLFYIVWDILSMRVYPMHYGVSHFSCRTVIAVYQRGAFAKGGGRREVDPFTTLWWFAIFVILLVCHRHHQQDFYVVALWTAVAYILYRTDQASPWPLMRRVLLSALLFGGLFLTEHVI